MKREKRLKKIIDIIIKSMLGRKMTFYKLCLRILVSAAFFCSLFLLIEYLSPKCSILKGRFSQEGYLVLKRGYDCIGNKNQVRAEL
ncbi:hypothetical protein FO510_02920 [Bacillus pumilus]|nr:hypothetical protein [Bacillus pumilus]PRS63705.1 hypothetical protein C6X97_08265 [Bacillus pumilus]